MGRDVVAFAVAVFVYAYEGLVTLHGVMSYDYLNMGLVIYIFISSLVILANYQFLTRHVYLYAINLILILLNLLIMT